MILKHLYETDLNPDEAFKRMKNSYKFVTKPSITSFSEKTLEGLESGYIYTYGRDRKCRPLCIVHI